MFYFAPMIVSTSLLKPSECKHHSTSQQPTTGNGSCAVCILHFLKSQKPSTVRCILIQRCHHVKKQLLRTNKTWQHLSCICVCINPSKVSYKKQICGYMYLFIWEWIHFFKVYILNLVCQKMPVYLRIIVAKLFITVFFTGTIIWTRLPPNHPQTENLLYKLCSIFVI